MADIEVPTPGASQVVARVLSEALADHPDVHWLGLMSEDGFAIASEGVLGVNDDAVAAGAVRMMVQVRAMAKALGQEGTSQMFLEGAESGICVIDKDPWVLVMVGAPGVPIGLLRFEALEIAEGFPLGQRAAIRAAEADRAAAEDEATEEPDEFEFTAVAPPEEPGVDPVFDMASAAPVAESVFDLQPVEFEEPDTPAPQAEETAPSEVELPVDEDIEPLVMTDLLADDQQWWTGDALQNGEPEPQQEDSPVSAEEPEVEIRWADEPISDAPAGAGQSDVPATDFADWTSPATFDLGETPAPDAPSGSGFDLAPPPSGDLSDAGAVPAGFGLADEPTAGMFDLGQLPPPSGAPIDLPPPTGMAYQLPPPE